MSNRLGILAGLFAIGFVTGAFAADASLLAKAPLKQQSSFFSGYPQGSGFYFGINGALATGKANQVSSTTAAANTGALVTQQGEVGVTLGYTWAASGMPIWFGLEGDFDFLNISSTQAPLTGLNLGGPADFEQIAILGAPWTAVAGLIPNLGSLQFPTLPALPNGVSAGPGNVYLFLGTYEQDISTNLGAARGRDWLLGFTSGVGTRWLLTNSTALDLRFEYRAPTQSTCVNDVLKQLNGCAGLGTSYMARTAVLF